MIQERKVYLLTLPISTYFLLPALKLINYRKTFLYEKNHSSQLQIFFPQFK